MSDFDSYSPAERVYPTGKRRKASTTMMTCGYTLVLVKSHPRQDSRGYVLEQILVMEEKLGRYLRPGELVLRKDRNRSNNHPDNLSLAGSKRCLVEGCDGKVLARGYCYSHYYPWHTYGDPHAVLFRPKIGCKVVGCDKPHHSKGYCRIHYVRFKAHGDPTITLRHVGYTGCSLVGCEEPHYLGGFCRRHYKRIRHHRGYKWRLRTRAMYAVKSALKKGVLKKLPCEVCQEVKVEAHHLSYFKEEWLNVLWLCKKHHESWHTTNKAVFPDPSYMITLKDPAIVEAMDILTDTELAQLMREAIRSDQTLESFLSHWYDDFRVKLEDKRVATLHDNPELLPSPQ